MTEPMRHCGKCGKDEPNVEFYPSFKHRHTCKGCHTIQRKAWRAANGDENRTAARASYKRDPEKYKKKKRDYYQENREKVARQFSDRYKADPDRFRGYARRWRADNPEKAAKVTRLSQQRLQDASLDGAARSGYEWTGWEMEIAGDTNRSLTEVARVTGRTYAASSRMRHKVLNDPKWMSAAGLRAAGTETGETS